MTRRKTAARTKERSALLGIRVSTRLKTEVKIEAARRGLTIAQLFEELWLGYLEREHAKGR
jgi:predicted DNA binding CopG/RHH family protein